MALMEISSGRIGWLVVYAIQMIGYLREMGSTWIYFLDARIKRDVFPRSCLKGGHEKYASFGKD
jgi:hypothetical protein